MKIHPLFYKWFILINHYKIKDHFLYKVFILNKYLIKKWKVNIKQENDKAMDFRRKSELFIFAVSIYKKQLIYI